jgi:putative membrane protein
MRSIATKILVNGVALCGAAFVLPGIRFGPHGAALSRQLGTVLLVAVIFGLVNALIKPVLTFFSLPFIVLTLGLFLVVINALMLQLTSFFADQLNLAFQVDQFFWDAVFGSIIITFVSMVLNRVLPWGRN